MPWIKIPNPAGGPDIVAHVKMAKGRRRRCCRCDRLIERGDLRLCDYKISPTKTCDVPICSRCTFEPAPQKDLCPVHRAAWDKHAANPKRKPDEPA